MLLSDLADNYIDSVQTLLSTLCAYLVSFCQQPFEFGAVNFPSEKWGLDRLRACPAHVVNHQHTLKWGSPKRVFWLCHLLTEKRWRQLLFTLADYRCASRGTWHTFGAQWAIFSPCGWIGVVCIFFSNTFFKTVLVYITGNMIPETKILINVSAVVFLVSPSKKNNSNWLFSIAYFFRFRDYKNKNDCNCFYSKYFLLLLLLLLYFCLVSNLRCHWF